MPLARKASLAALIIAVSLFAAGSTSAGDALLRQAASLFREKNYSDAARTGQKSPPSPEQTFLTAVALMRADRPEEALPLLAEAEKSLPMLADYAALYQAECLHTLKKDTEAAAKAGSIPKAYSGAVVVRRAEKLFLDASFALADYRGVLKSGQEFLERYASGGDSVDVLAMTARSREETGDRSGAAAIYRSIWLNNPHLPQAKMAKERLTSLEKQGIRVEPYSAEELLKRASTLFSQGNYKGSLQTLQGIPQGQSAAITARISLRSGHAQYKQRNFKAAEKSFALAAECTIPGIRSEGRLWHAKSLERQDNLEAALKLYLDLAGEGKKQELAEDAVMEAGGLLRSQGRFSEAARLFDRIPATGSRFSQRAVWDGAWSHYLAGEMPAAVEGFKAVARNDATREKGLYWLARALDRSGSPEAGGHYRMLLDEFPAGFYACWHREQKGLPDSREALGQINPLAELPLPPGFEKARLLGELGMLEEARAEVAAARKRLGDKKAPPTGLIRIYAEAGDHPMAIPLFQQNRPQRWDRASLPLWSAGFPIPYAATVTKNSAENALSDALVFGLTRSESAFAPAVKSPAGAIGLMQLMPATAKLTAREKGVFNAMRLTDPEYNIKLGTRHFRELLKQYDGDAVYAIAAYNAGANAVDRWRKNLKGLQKDEFIESIPYLETRNYVKKVYASAAIYRKLYGLR